MIIDCLYKIYHLLINYTKPKPAHMKNVMIRKTILLCICFIVLINYAQSAVTEGKFKDWNYSPTDVFGLIKLDNTNHKKYFKIIKNAEQKAVVEEYNQADVLQYTTTFTFVNGVISIITTTDEWGNTYNTRKFVRVNNNEFYVTQINYGKNSLLPCKLAKYVYKDNLLLQVDYLSAEKKLLNNLNGIATIKYIRYDDKNRFSITKEQSFYDASGKAVIAKNYDCHKAVYVYDERVNEISESYYGINNEPLADRYGGFKTVYRYDEDDNEIGNNILDMSDNIVNNSYGVAKMVYQYNKGLVDKEIRYNNKNEITVSSDAGDGIAIVKYAYDANGNLTAKSFYDANEAAINNHNGYHSIAYQYNSRNMLTDEKYLNTSYTLVADKYGVAHYAYGKDEKGRLIQETFYDGTEKPVTDKTNEVYMQKFKYDEAGRRYSTSYWENSEKKMNRWNGYHESISKFDEDGQLTELLFTDENGNPFLNKSGYSRETISYNANGQIAQRSFFNGIQSVSTSNSLVNYYHSIQYHYDDKGRVAYLQYFNTENTPTNANIDLNGEFICHKIEFIYTGNAITEEKFYILGNTNPVRQINCLLNNYISTAGYSIGYKNQ